MHKYIQFLNTETCHLGISEMKTAARHVLSGRRLNLPAEKDLDKEPGVPRIGWWRSHEVDRSGIRLVSILTH